MQLYKEGPLCDRVHATFALSGTSILNVTTRFIFAYRSGSFQKKAPLWRLFCWLIFDGMRNSNLRRTMNEKFLKGIDLFNRGLYFEAHEIWEEAWNESEGVEKRCLQALIQIAVALLKWQSGIPGGALKMYRAAREKLEALPDACLGIDLRKVESDFIALLERLAANEKEPFPEKLGFRLRMI